MDLLSPKKNKFKWILNFTVLYWSTNSISPLCCHDNVIFICRGKYIWFFWDYVICVWWICGLSRFMATIRSISVLLETKNMYYIKKQKFWMIWFQTKIEWIVEIYPIFDLWKIKFSNIKKETKISRNCYYPKSKKTAVGDYFNSTWKCQEMWLFSYLLEMIIFKIEYNNLKCYLDIRYCENSNNFMTLSSNSFVDLGTKVGLSNDRNLHGPKLIFFPQ